MSWTNFQEKFIPTPCSESQGCYERKCAFKQQVRCSAAIQIKKVGNLRLRRNPFDLPKVCCSSRPKFWPELTGLKSGRNECACSRYFPWLKFNAFTCVLRWLVQSISFCFKILAVFHSWGELNGLHEVSWTQFPSCFWCCRLPKAQTSFLKDRSLHCCPSFLVCC